MESVRIAVLLGGVSSEREVSLRSGTAIANALKTRGHRVTCVDVTTESLRDHLNPEDFDVAFIALHGKFGEDGAVQRQCEEMGLAYSGSRPKASALALDKIRAKEIFIFHGLSTPPFEVIKGADRAVWNLLDRLGLPLVVKPPLEGSSIGLSIVRENAELAGAVNMALRYGDMVLVEAFVCGRELTVGILQDEALPVIQVVPKKGVYDYHSKYTPGQTEYLVPAPLDFGTTQKVKVAALRAFRALGCEDLGRVDFILADNGGLFVLEVNTIPGFTQTSLLPKAAREQGIAFEELCERIMVLGLQRTQKNENIPLPFVRGGIGRGRELDLMSELSTSPCPSLQRRGEKLFSKEVRG